MNYLTKELIFKIDSIPSIRLNIGDLVSKVEKDSIIYIKIGELTASIMGPLDIFVNTNKIELPVYYTMLDGGDNEKIKLSNSLDNYLKILNILIKYSSYIDKEDFEEDYPDIYNNLINEIKEIDSNIEFWKEILFL